ncbi:hypothetical protein BTURTLESOX_1609 [bacterium endosymbiont of Bathymodiolus sp. 5 South]|nr:hypothetical protein BTURTLESOX_1609 [bacterium endosymbiont of Bathymodiolus sp. 5 South]
MIIVLLIKFHFGKLVYLNDVGDSIITAKALYKFIYLCETFA